MNPLKKLDDLLADWVSARVRRLIHTALSALVVLVSIWFAVEGDWVQFGIAVLALFYTESNRANTPVSGNQLNP